ncbi:Glu/Leu/Phe/Val dehydrogenase family protein [Sphingomonas colocasiae]|uniref:Amino acid dehydrogenase n=1 Tax=Sphingomonas colocasiae TaxID=1848973 RepID=A0ABS7PLJ8_9SPHN|nr:Glu/Leu/Phe/Val dehydrogenase family protein [Sphingomonas colocasiae]MBY8821854.1 amino acid dehydrogenase [Sphingomonas colocasiae]
MRYWDLPEFDDHEQTCLFTDRETGLRVVVAIHSTHLGPACGGTRYWHYASDGDAVADALRLSRAMSYKSALAGVAMGGGKAVMLRDPARPRTREQLLAYGGVLNRLNGQFATGEDVGFSVADCEIIRTVSPYVGGTESAGAGDPSIHTATGVFNGLRGVVKRALDRDDLQGVHVAVQGLGNVGWRLAEGLAQAGARLTVTDIDADRLERARVALNAETVAPDAILGVEADILAPCALGGLFDSVTVAGLRVRAIAGAANNQLATADAGAALRARGILYAPDFVINAGGVIGAAEEIAAMPGRNIRVTRPIEDRLADIETRLLDIFDRADRAGETPEATAMALGRELIGR